MFVQVVGFREMTLLALSIQIKKRPFGGIYAIEGVSFISRIDWFVLIS